MRGAVLHRLGFNFVNQRIMRRSYGVTYLKTPFVPGVDPENLREISPLGLPACRDVMRWYVTKVPSIDKIFICLILGRKGKEWARCVR